MPFDRAQAISQLTPQIMIDMFFDHDVRRPFERSQFPNDQKRYGTFAGRPICEAIKEPYLGYITNYLNYIIKHGILLWSESIDEVRFQWQVVAETESAVEQGVQTYLENFGHL